MAEVNGSVLDLPAGSVQLAAGVTHRKDFSQTIPDAIEVPNPANDFICDIGTGCVSPISGSFNVKEVYAELLIPILKDVPFANALNLTVGDRYSRYSNFGGTNNTKFALEYRPIEDLLLRGTVSKVFRAPTISDLFAGAASFCTTGGGSLLRPAWHQCGLRGRYRRRQLPVAAGPDQPDQRHRLRLGSRRLQPARRNSASRSTTASSTIRTGSRACR